MLFSEFQKKKKKRERKTEIYYFTNLLFLTTMIHLKIKKSLYTPCIAFTHLLYPIYLPTYSSHSYYKHLFTHFTTTIYLPIFTTIILLLFIFILHVLPYHLSNYYASIIFFYFSCSTIQCFFYFNMCISSCFLN